MELWFMFIRMPYNYASSWWHGTITLVICTWILKNQVRQTGFLACKNQCRNWFLQATLKFIELDFSRLIFQKSSKYRSTGCKEPSLETKLNVLTLLDLTSNLNEKTWHINKLFLSDSSSKLSSQIKIDLLIFRSWLKQCWSQNFIYLTQKTKICCTIAF